MASGASGPSPSRSAHPAAAADTGGERQRILIIDDEKDVHYSFRRLLEKEPLEIITAESGDEGIRQARKTPPDLIVMDIRMGQQSGLDTLKELRQMNPKQVVIMMTAYGTSQTAIEAMKLGAYDYVLKPFDIPHLKDLLFEALAAAAGLQAHRTGRPDQRDHPHHRRKRHRKRAGRPRDLPERLALQQALHRHQLRGHPGKPARERALRPREGRVYRRDGPAHRQVRTVRRRHALPR
jgi:DNA-binding response OmpR family regulator